MVATADWVLEQTNSVGIGSILLSGAIETFSSFADGVPAGEVWYSIQDSNGNRETGIGTFDGDATLARTTVQATLIGTVYNDVNPTPIYLSGNAVVSCVFSSASYKDLLDKIVDSSALVEVEADDVSYAPAGDPVTVATNVQNALIAHGVAIDENNTDLNARIDAISIEASTYEIVERYFDYADFDLTPPNTVVTTDAILSTDTNNLDVYVSGVIQRYGIDFDIPSSTTIRIINKTLGENDYILAKIAVPSIPTGADELRADLEASTGTDLIGYGDRTLTEKLQDTVSIMDFGAVGDGVSDDTISFQTALNAAAGGILWVNKPPVMFLVSDSLSIPSNTAVILDPGVVIKTAPGSFITADAILRMDKKNNITIYGNGCTLQGLREGTGTDLISMGVSITGSTNIRVFDVNTIDSSGDGFYIAGASDNSVMYSQDVWIERCVADNNMRQGMSIVGAWGLTVKDSVFKNTNGKAPSAGLDIEPDPTAPLFNIRIINCEGVGNAASQFVCDFNHTVGPVDIVFDKCLAYDAPGANAMGFQVSNAFANKAETGMVRLIDCIARNTDSYGLVVRNINKDGVAVRIKDFQSINTNTGQRTNYGAVDSPVAIYAGNSPTYYPNPGNVRIDGLKIYDEVASRGPYSIVSDGTGWDDVVITGLEWENTVGYSAIPYMDDDTTNTRIEWSHKPFQVTRTSNTTLTPRWNGWCFNNIGDTNAVVYTLPPVAPNLEFSFEVHAAFVVRITPNAADRLQPYASANAKYMESSVVGSTAYIRSNADGTDWIVQRWGTWVDET